MLPTRPFVVTNVTLITLDKPGVISGGWLHVADRRIQAFGGGRPTVPADAEMIDGRGGSFIPGLVDMHVHLGFAALLRAPDAPERKRLEAEAADELALYLAHGVTSVRNMWGAPFHLALASAVADSRVPGPRIWTTSPILDGAPPTWPTSRVITDSDKPAEIVAWCQTEGYEAIKVYNNLPAETYLDLVVAGERAGLPVVGHVPYQVGVETALKAGQRSIEHFRGYDFDSARPPGSAGAPPRFDIWRTRSDEDLARLAAQTKQSGAWNCPTLATLKAVEEMAQPGGAALPALAQALPSGARAQMALGLREPVFPADMLARLASSRPRQRAFLKMLHDEGCGLLVGTDAPLLNLIPGDSLHAELEEFVAAGLTPREALICCCRNPGDYHGERLSGRICIGGRADLVLLEADPLLDIRNTRRIAAVIANGEWRSRASLSDLIAQHGAIAQAGRASQDLQ